MAFEKTLLFDSYYICEAEPSEFDAFYTANEPKVYGDTLTIHESAWMTAAENQQRYALYQQIQNRYSLILYILKDDERIGWHYGWQIDEEKYYMCDTGLLPEYRGHGIYKALLKQLLEIYGARGFQKVISRHIASNNTVIVAKLKAGFVITGFELDERFGMMVVLAYIFNKNRMDVYKIRTGEERPDGRFKNFI